MTQQRPRFTGCLADIARVAGDEAALTIGRALGGTQVYFPSAPAADHWLSQMVGHEAAVAIGEELTAGIGGIRIDVPVGQFGHAESLRAKVDRMIAEGKSERDIALTTRYTTRGVRKRRALLRERQPDLFDI
ncbi:MAG: hypothetical protein AAFQ13_10500 [Pseudomonadota bacterium]